MKQIKAVADLIQEFRKLPTIGPKTAERLVYFLLKAPPELSFDLARALERLKKETVICQTCFNVAAQDPCVICRDPQRANELLCIVEEPLDALAIEKTGRYRGRYHILGGVINPMAGITPRELRISELKERLLKNSAIQEIILATNPSLEGEATAMYLKEQLKQWAESWQQHWRITRLARGLPTGGELEYADQLTLTRALEGRVDY